MPYTRLRRVPLQTSINELQHHSSTYPPSLRNFPGTCILSDLRQEACALLKDTSRLRVRPPQRDRLRPHANTYASHRAMATSSLANGDAGEIRRASGRVRKQPGAYTSSAFSTGKRKRHDEDANGDADMADEEASDEDVDSEDGEPDEEEIREKKKQSRKPKSSAPKKPTKKKPKVNGTSSLPFRTVTGGGRKKMSKKAKAAAAADDEPDSLYAHVFAGEQRLEEIVAGWLKRFEDGPEAAALGELVNFILKCAGCDIKVTDDDIGDPDGASNRLTDIQDEYQRTSPIDYPLIAKGKAGDAFKHSLADFVQLLIASSAAKGILFGDSELISNVEVWFVTMSSAASRAFRHTATVASLAVISALCEIAAGNAKSAADAQRQVEGERKKQKLNKARVKQLEQTVADKNAEQEYIESTIDDWFDAVFIHRYRDLDPAIRRDCVIALGDWVVALPYKFFDGHHLRYLGWMLSDTVAPTRSEVVKQLRRLYKDKDKTGGLKTFTERFRGRLVEMAVSDAETNVRVSGIELLSNLREHGLLEPDQVDEVGSLIYDADEKIRKAVAGFFAENVNDTYLAKIDDLGGQDSLDEVLPEVSEENFEVLRIEWLKFKSLAEIMVAHGQNDNVPEYAERNRGDGSLSLRAGAAESMFSLAAESLFDAIDNIREWQALAGYLLYDHSSGRANGVSNDTLSMLKHECILNEQEEQVLLEVVSASVKQTIVSIGERSTAKGKLTKRQREDLAEEQDEAARHLAGLIPKLLKKFGDSPRTAAAVLRMESVLSLPSLQEIRQDTVTYGALLDDIRKQFMSHGTDEVLGPASEAILHAKSYGEVDDLAEEKVSSLWEDVVGNLDELINADTIAVRGASQSHELLAMSNNLLRITRLAQISNPVAPLEDSSVAKDHEASGADYQGAIDYVIALIERAVPTSGPAPDAEDAALEDLISARAGLAAIRYLQWKLTYIITSATSSSVAALSMDELEALAMRRDRCVDNLAAVLQARKAGDRICADLAGYLLELHSSAVTLKNVKPKPGVSEDWVVLIMDLQDHHVKSIWKVFKALEKNFAKLTGKKLEDVDVDIDANPVDDDPESDLEDEDDDTQPTQSQAVLQRREIKQRQAIIAETKLCELTRALIFAVHAGVIDAATATKRLELNKAKLGQNFREMLNYLDVGNLGKDGALKSRKARSKTKAKAKPAAVAAAKKNAKSNAIVADDEEDDEIEDEEEARQRELDADAGVEEREEGGEAAEGGGEVESVLGD